MLKDLGWQYRDGTALFRANFEAPQRRGICAGDKRVILSCKNSDWKVGGRLPDRESSSKTELKK
jgi:hypothetical protein